MAMSPRLSVIMPVYNGGEYLNEAIDSVLNQTFKDYEFIIIDDGSTDNSVEIVNSYEDKRIRMIRNSENLGIAMTLNHGLKLSCGEYVLRMDADDVCLPQRLEKQVAFMDSNPEVGVSGTFIKTLGEKNEKVWHYPTVSDDIKCLLLFNSVLVHPSVIMRRETLNRYDLFYSSDFPHAEDYEFWVKCSKYMKLANIDEVLLFLRQHPKKVGSVHEFQQRDTADIIRLGQIKELGIQPTEKELDLHKEICSLSSSLSFGFVISSEKWFLKLIKANAISSYFPESTFSNILALKWLDMCSKSQNRGLVSLKRFLKSELIQSSNLPFRKIFIFVLKYTINRS